MGKENQGWPRFVVQRVSDRAFLTADGGWSSKISAARNFGGTTLALDYCLEKSMRDVRLVLKFSDAKYDIILPVIQPSSKPRTA